MLIVFSGPACSGKSTLAAHIAAELGAPHLQMDETRARLMPLSAHTREDRQVAYRAMAFAAELLTGAGASVVLDAPYGHREDRVELGRLPLVLIECKLDPEVAVARFRTRDPNHPAMQDLTEQRVREIGQTFPYTGKGLLLDTGAFDAGQCLVRIREYLAPGRALKPGEWVK